MMETMMMEKTENDVERWRRGSCRGGRPRDRQIRRWSARGGGARPTGARSSKGTTLGVERIKEAVAR
jgi:hypothetical protein